MYVSLRNGPPPTNPNDVPRPRPEDETAFFYYFGTAMSSWQDLELYIYLLLVHLIKPAHPSALFAALYEVYSFKTRLEMIDMAIEHRFPDLSEEWKKLSSKVSTKSKRRNLLAHLIVYFDPTISQTNRQLFLGQPMITAPKGADTVAWVADGAIDTSQLRDMGEAFSRLRNELVDFGLRLPEPLLLTASPQQALSPTAS
jgi:hypothetical protein